LTTLDLIKSAFEHIVESRIALAHDARWNAHEIVDDLADFLLGELVQKRLQPLDGVGHQLAPAGVANLS
jgi:hypothetical protein